MLNRDTLRKFIIIDALARLEQPSLADLAEETAIPEATLKRQITLLRKEFRMDIQFVRHPHSLGRSGYYVLADWGIIQRDAFLSHYGGLR